MARFTSPVFQALSKIGTPLPGAQLTVFATGTTTKITLYLDDAETQETTNPVIANGSGIFPQFFFSGTTKQRLESSRGVLQWERDPVKELAEEDTLNDLIVILQDFVKRHNSIAQLKADTDLVSGQAVFVTSYQGTSANNVNGFAHYRIMTLGEFGGTPDERRDHTLNNGLIAKLERQTDATNVKEAGAIGDGTDATEAIRVIKQDNQVAYQPDGSFPDTRNGEFYLYVNNASRDKMGRIRLAGGGTIDRIVDDGRPIIMIEKIMERTQANDTNWPGSFDGGCLMTQYRKAAGDTFGVAITGFARDDGGTGGDIIGVHGRGKGTHPKAEIFGGWSYADIDPVNSTDLIAEAIGHEVDVKNDSNATPPFNNRPLPPGSTQGEYRGIVLVTADGSKACNTALDIGAQRSTASLGWYTGLRLRELGIEPSDVIGQDTAQMRVQGGGNDSEAYGGITFDFGFFTYGIDMTGSTYRNGEAIRLKLGDGVFNNGVKVLGDQQAAISDAAGSSSATNQTKINQILAALRAHGLIAT